MLPTPSDRCIVAELTAGLNLRAVTASLTPVDADTREPAVAMPVIERMSRYLMVPHADWTDEIVRPPTPKNTFGRITDDPDPSYSDAHHLGHW